MFSCVLLMTRPSSLPTHHFLGVVCRTQHQVNEDIVNGCCCCCCCCSPREEMPKGGTPLDLYFAPEPYLSQVMALQPRPDPHTARVSTGSTVTQ
jgi:hypothetical protein